MTDKVASLFGGPTGERTPSVAAIEVVDEVSEMVMSGELVGVLIVGMGHDGCCMYRIGGRVGGYSMLGAAEIAVDDLRDVVRGR